MSAPAESVGSRGTGRSGLGRVLAPVHALYRRALPPRYRRDRYGTAATPRNTRHHEKHRQDLRYQALARLSPIGSTPYENPLIGFVISRSAGPAHRLPIPGGLESTRARWRPDQVAAGARQATARSPSAAAIRASRSGLDQVAHSRRFAKASSAAEFECLTVWPAGVRQPPGAAGVPVGFLR